MRILFTICALALGILPAIAQQYPANTIPEGLRAGADAVVRYSETEVEYASPTLLREHNKLVVTVLTPDGDEWANFMTYTDMFRSLSGFSGEIYDGAGKLLRKIKKSDLKYSDYSGAHLETDNRTHYYELSAPRPPYTVKYEWEITTRNAVWAFPMFVPQPTRSMGVEKAVYRLEAPADFRFYTKTYNFEPEYRTTPSEKAAVYEWGVENIAPLASVPYAKPIWEILPMVYFSPETFIYDKVAGGMKDWQSYAEWQWKLLERSGAVPAELNAFVADLTKGAQSDMEKIRILYDYLAAETRYVSIQIGIGGFQPMPVERVHKTKYGDCKALTNYLRLMLAECGINSHYVEIGMRRRSIPHDFVSPAMSNHAILMVPAGTDTLWVECTNPELPLGYRHRSIVGQNALVYKDGTAEVVTVPHYADSLNLSERYARVAVQAGGGATAHVVTTNHMHRFEDYWSLEPLNSTDRINKLREEINLPNARLSNPVYSEEKGAEPTAVVEYDLSTPQIGSRTGDRLFVNTISFRQPYSPRFPRGERTEDICVREGRADSDITHLTIPEGAFEIEALPAPVVLNSKYGTYSLVCHPTDGGITVERRFLLHRGLYGKEEYVDFRNFVEAASRADNSKIVLRNISGGTQTAISGMQP